MRIICTAFIAAAAAGCVSSYSGSAEPADPSLFGDAAWRRAQGVPVFLQESPHACGAAALSMVLGMYGQGPTLISGQASDLRDAARNRGLAAYCISATREDLETELADGRPVLVGLVKPTIAGAIAHYEVVVGLDPEGGRVATHDPARGLTVNTWAGFDREWEGARRLAVVISPR